MNRASKGAALLVLAALLGPSSSSSAQEPADAGVITMFEQAHPCYDVPADTFLVPKASFDKIDNEMKRLQAKSETPVRADDNVTRTALIWLGVGAGVGTAVGIIATLVVKGLLVK